MAMVTFTSNHNTNLSQTLPFDKTNGYPVKKKEEDGEIGVFGAEKYFNGAIDAAAGGGPRPTKLIPKNLESCTKQEVITNPEPMKPLFHAPSIRSESSWNSQNPLLHTVIQNPPQQKPSKSITAKSFLSCLPACKCYCFDRSSIDIEVGEISFKRPNGEVILQSKQKKTAAGIKEDLFTFPTMNPAVGIRPVSVPLQGDVDEFGRKSLEVFGSPVLGIGRRNKSLNLERRLKMLSWDHHAIPKVEETENSKANCNDTESDASSDLFEIESLTGKPNYAPSEASIEWSVVTASAADFSAMSDYEEGRPSLTLPSPIKTFYINSTTKINKERPRSGGLLGCNSSKTVKIARDAHKTNQKAGLDSRMRRVSDSYMPVTRFRAETKLEAGAFEPTRTPQILPTRSLPVPHSHSPQQASHLLYIQ
ncbi:hypothetical protein Godav_000707 [Gossypium davidsonii]|uniref:Protein PHYTOCHROME KINASE SUBSTRATE 1-like n=2 Tax=Gossypium TaxID=3633 RepID=A0A7J8T296_GOSDV|nr:hypothetical protein [Gossypium davidsonii]MBA0667617.1 hypothetical protein [Gossypium klotzschianum]